MIKGIHSAKNNYKIKYFALKLDDLEIKPQKCLSILEMELLK